VVLSNTWCLLLRFVVISESLGYLASDLLLGNSCSGSSDLRFYGLCGRGKTYSLCVRSRCTSPRPSASRPMKVSQPREATAYVRDRQLAFKEGMTLGLLSPSRRALLRRASNDLDGKHTKYRKSDKHEEITPTSNCLQDRYAPTKTVQELLCPLLFCPVQEFVRRSFLICFSISSKPISTNHGAPKNHDCIPSIIGLVYLLKVVFSTAGCGCSVFYRPRPVALSLCEEA
jgi:hypothetical protein